MAIDSSSTPPSWTTRAKRQLSGLGRVAVPLVYSRRYRIELPGAATDPLRGERILAFLAAEGLITARRLHVPEAATYQQLRRVHTEEYIDSLLTAAQGRRILRFLGGPAELRGAAGARAAAWRVDLARVVLSKVIMHACTLGFPYRSR